FFQAEDGIRYWSVTGVQTCALPIWSRRPRLPHAPGPAGLLRRHRRPHGPRGASRDGEAHRREAAGEEAMSFWGPVGFLSPFGFLSPPALVALSTSACVGVALKLGGSPLERLSPATQARVYLTAALAPAFAGTVFFGGAVAAPLPHRPPRRV